MNATSSPAARGSSFSRAVGRAALRIAGWRIVGDIPALPKIVIIVAPHTSNWDFIIGVSARLALGLDVHWLGKHTIFTGPLGKLLVALGGMPVRRDSNEGIVRQVADRMNAEPVFVLALAPEGTRKRVPQWRTGFHHIARATGSPIVPVWLDWSRHEVGIGTPFTPTDDLAGDVAKLHAMYRPSMARHPQGFVSAAESA